MTTQVASRDFTPVSKGQRSRSQRHVTYQDKNCNNSVADGPIKFILGGLHEDDLPTNEAQNGCHGNAGRLETGPLNLLFMASYLQNDNIYKLPNRHIYSTPHSGYVTQFW